MSRAGLAGRFSLGPGWFIHLCVHLLCDGRCQALGAHSWQWGFYLGLLEGQGCGDPRGALTQRDRAQEAEAQRGQALFPGHPAGCWHAAWFSS